MKNIKCDAEYARCGAAVAADAMSLSAAPTVEGDELQLIDVRRAATHAQAEDRLAGASWKDTAKLAHWSAELDRSKPMLVYCLHRGKGEAVDAVKGVKAALDAQQKVAIR